MMGLPAPRRRVEVRICRHRRGRGIPKEDTKGRGRAVLSEDSKGRTLAIPSENSAERGLATRSGRAIPTEDTARTGPCPHFPIGG